MQTCAALNGGETTFTISQLHMEVSEWSVKLVGIKPLDGVFFTDSYTVCSCAFFTGIPDDAIHILSLSDWYNGRALFQNQLCPLHLRVYSFCVTLGARARHPEGVAKEETSNVDVARRERGGVLDGRTGFMARKRY